MTTVLVYNRSKEKVERYYLENGDGMPYVPERRLTVAEFRGSSKANIVWTDRRFMETFAAFRRYYGRPIPVGFAFKRIWEGGHGNQSQHYAGSAFDCGQSLTAARRKGMWNSAVAFGGWSYVEPQRLTPTWVHFDKRLGPPACSSGGYITVRYGSRGVYVLIMQDALNALGYTGGGLDGIFGGGTLDALRRFQRDAGLASDGVSGCQTWRTLTAAAVGIGKTPTVID